MPIKDHCLSFSKFSFLQLGSGGMQIITQQAIEECWLHLLVLKCSVAFMIRSAAVVALTRMNVTRGPKRHTLSMRGVQEARETSKICIPEKDVYGNQEKGASFLCGRIDQPIFQVTYQTRTYVIILPISLPVSKLIPLLPISSSSFAPSRCL